ncbi:MAG: hypothetical protein AAFP90_21035, partial [Planctomycetota bacterium]
SVLKDKNTNALLNAQFDAAMCYELWASQMTNPKYQNASYKSALLGARKGAGGKNTLWGFGRLSSVTSGKEQFAEIFYNSRYHLAVCRFGMAKSQRSKDLYERAIKDITNFADRYPTLGGVQLKRKFDVLLREVQKSAGKPQTGLP